MRKQVLKCFKKILMEKFNKQNLNGIYRVVYDKIKEVLRGYLIGLEQ